MTATTQPTALADPTVGGLLRGWRALRRLSQLQLADQAGISARHLCFVETGRANPSRDMVLRLADELDVPLRERNPLLLAAGYAPSYAETALAEPPMSAVRAAIRQILTGHDPYPALVVDRDWNIVDANRSFALFTDGAAPELLRPPVNALRLTLHPEGMAPRIVNLGEWRAHLMNRLRRSAATNARRRKLYDELCGYPCDQDEPRVDEPGHGDFSVPLHLRHGDQVLAFFGILATFGTPRDITVAELTIESFFPTDQRTVAALQERSQ